MLDINGVGQGDHAAVLGAEFGPDPERTLWNGDDDGARRDRSVGEPSLLVRKPQPASGVAPELGLHPYAITIFSEIVRQLSNEKQIIISTQSVELLNEFDVEDVIVVDRSDTGSEFRRLDPEQLKLWLDGDYTLGDLWKKNVLGGRLSK